MVFLGPNLAASQKGVEVSPRSPRRSTALSKTPDVSRSGASPGFSPAVGPDHACVPCLWERELLPEGRVSPPPQDTLSATELLQNLLRQVTDLDPCAAGTQELPPAVKAGAPPQG